MKESVRLTRFVMVGTLNYLITMAVVWAMMSVLCFDGDYLVANITAYLIAQTHNFIWCKYWIFPASGKEEKLWRQVMLFCTAFAVAYTVQFLCLLCMVEVMQMNEYVAQLVGIVIYGAINFLVNRRITFK